MVVVTDPDECMDNPFPPKAAYHALMERRLVALEKWPGVLPMGIGETIYRAFAKFVLRAAGDQDKTACGNSSCVQALRPVYKQRITSWGLGGVREAGVVEIRWERRQKKER